MLLQVCGISGFIVNTYTVVIYSLRPLVSFNLRLLLQYKRDTCTHEFFMSLFFFVGFFHLFDGYCSESFLQLVISPCIPSQHKTLRTLKTCCLFIWMQLSFHNFENRTFGEFASIHGRIMQDHVRNKYFFLSIPQ